MDPFERLQFPRKKVNVQAVIAFVLGVVIAYVVQQGLGLRGGGLFTALILIAVGGFWYHLRRVV